MSHSYLYIICFVFYFQCNYCLPTFIDPFCLELSPAFSLTFQLAVLHSVIIMLLQLLSLICEFGQLEQFLLFRLLSLKSFLPQSCLSFFGFDFWKLFTEKYCLLYGSIKYNKIYMDDVYNKIYMDRLHILIDYDGIVFIKVKLVNHFNRAIWVYCTLIQL